MIPSSALRQAPVPVRAVLAEDEFLVAEVVTAELRAVGAVVVGLAHDGAQAIELTERLRPDVVVMDVQMPETDGIAACRAIQRQCPTPVVMLTVHADEGSVLASAEAGAGAYVVKPGDAESLERAIVIARARFDDMMELRRVNEELRRALERVHTLSGLLPICANCKKIRDDQGRWRPLEVYVAERSAAAFTHSICPRCARALYPDVAPDADE